MERQINTVEQIKPYKKSFEYSYTLGAFPTIEMIKNVLSIVFEHAKLDESIICNLLMGNGILINVVGKYFVLPMLIYYNESLLWTYLDCYQFKCIDSNKLRQFHFSGDCLCRNDFPVSSICINSRGFEHLKSLIIKYDY